MDKTANREMTRSEQLDFLIAALKAESPRYRNLMTPSDPDEKWRLFRALVNMRLPEPIGAEFLRVQDAFLKELIAEKGVTDVGELTPIRDRLYLWRGDMTTLNVDGIVNAANSALLGCFAPGHGCIDNAIHTYAGVQLRLACREAMDRQGYPEPTGRAKITPAFNLPSRFVLHTVGPIIRGRLTAADRDLLACCYRSCLEAAAANGLESLAFCCISTGEFRFPRQDAAEIAVDTVEKFVRGSAFPLKVVFNVFSDPDERIYRTILTSSIVREGAGNE